MANQPLPKEHIVRTFSLSLVLVTVFTAGFAQAANLETIKEATVSTSANLVVFGEGQPTPPTELYGFQAPNKPSACTIQFKAVSTQYPQFKLTGTEAKMDGDVFSFAPTEDVQLKVTKIEAKTENEVYNGCGSEPQDCDDVDMKRRTVIIDLTDKANNQWAMICLSDLKQLSEADPVIDTTEFALPGISIR